MNKILSLLISVPIALVIIIFSLINRHGVTIDFWPLPATMDIPLFAVILVTLMIGVLWGGLAAWLAAGRVRKRVRELNRRITSTDADVRHLEEHNVHLRDDLEKAKPGKNNAAKTLMPPADAA